MSRVFHHRNLKSPVVLKRLLMAGLIGLLSGCTLVQKVFDLPVEGVRTLLLGVHGTKPVDPVVLQDNLLRFADTYITTTSLAVEKLEDGGKPIDRYKQLLFKVRLATDMVAMATGANAVGNLVNMLVYVGSVRTSFEDYWIPANNGLMETPLLAVIREREANIWSLAEAVLSQAQRDEVHKSIEQWRNSHKLTAFDIGTFASASQVSEIIANTESTGRKTTSVFTLLDVDPLSGLDPATRELAETRLFGERALFIGRRMPQIIEWQAELLTYRTTSNPEVVSAVTSAAAIAEASGRLSRTLELFPGFISGEREKVLEALHSEQAGLTALSSQVGLSFGEGSKMAESTRQMMQTLDALLQREEARPSDPSSEPFRIRDYADTAEKIEGMTTRLAGLLQTLQPLLEPESLEKLTRQTDRLTQNAQQRVESVVDYLFFRLISLIIISVLVTCLAVVASALLYRFLLARMRSSLSA